MKDSTKMILWGALATLAGAALNIVSGILTGKAQASMVTEAKDNNDD